MASIHTPSDHVKVTEMFVDDLAGLATAADGTEVDARGFRRALIIVTVEAMGGTAPTLDVKLRESATAGGSYADVTGGAFTQMTTGPSTFLMDVDLTKRLRFLKLNTDSGGTAQTGASAGIIVLMSARTQNPTQDETVKSV